MLVTLESYIVYAYTKIMIFLPPSKKFYAVKNEHFTIIIKILK